MARTVQRSQRGIQIPRCVERGTSIKLVSLYVISPLLVTFPCLGSVLWVPKPGQSYLDECCIWPTPAGHALTARRLTDVDVGQTIFLCVWQAIHLNIPPPGEPPYKQILRRAGWSILAIIAPEVVALNAWLQYRRARKLMSDVNQLRGLGHGRVDQTWLERLQGHLSSLGSRLGMICMFPVSLADYTRMILFHTTDLRTSRTEKQRSINDDLLSLLDSDQLPWTMATAYYALCGGAVLASDCGMGETLLPETIVWLAKTQSASLLPLQKAVLQDPSKASGLAKMITCTQAFWFCSQCIARLSQDMALSLLELNTFAHCISALCIYAFWYHKPYDVETHAYINSLYLYQHHLMLKIMDEAGGHISESMLGCTLMTVNERTVSGDLTTQVNASSTYKYEETRKYHKGLTSISGTGFKVRLASANLLYFESDASSALWEELWRVRVSCNHSEPPKHSLGLSNKVCHPRVRNFDSSLSKTMFRGQRFLVPLVMILTFLIYGGIHLLAWQYHFSTKAESDMWRSASIVTASSGLIILLSNGANNLIYMIEKRRKLYSVADLLAIGLLTLLTSAVIIARSFLFIESFRALPNSPASTYEVPRWTTYVPHI